MNPPSSRIMLMARKSAAFILKPVNFLDYSFAKSSSNFTDVQESQVWNRVDGGLLVFFVHFDHEEFINEIDTRTLDFLVENGYNVKLVTNNRKLSRCGYEPIFAKNLGRDLGVYRDLVQTLCRMDYRGKAILLNNSIAWMNNEKLLQAMAFLEENCNPNTVSTLVESLQPRQHHQSFAFALDFQSEFVSSVFNHIKNVKLKRTLITFGELRIGKEALKRGLKIKSMFTYENIVSEFKTGKTKNGNRIEIQQLIHLQIPLNPTQHFWNEIISLGFPGFKKNLLTSNPAKLSYLPEDYTDVT